MAGNATPVVVFDPYQPEITYHLPGWLDPRPDPKTERHWKTGEKDDGTKFQQVSVVCGRVSWRYEWKGEDRGRDVVDSNRMRWDHARKIGRMCAQCAHVYYHLREDA